MIVATCNSLQDDGSPCLSHLPFSRSPTCNLPSSLRKSALPSLDKPQSAKSPSRRDDGSSCLSIQNTTSKIDLPSPSKAEERSPPLLIHRRFDISREPPIWHDDFLPRFIPQPCGPPRVTTICDDMVARQTHQIEIMQGIGLCSLETQNMDIRLGKNRFAPCRIIRENEKTRSGDSVAHLLHRLFVIREITYLKGRMIQKISSSDMHSHRLRVIQHRSYLMPIYKNRLKKP